MPGAARERRRAPARRASRVGPGAAERFSSTSVILARALKECNNQRDWVVVEPNYAAPSQGDICLYAGQEFYLEDGSSLICELTGNGLRWIAKDAPTVKVMPSWQRTELDTSVGNWTVDIMRSPTRVMTVYMSYGDGTSADTQTVAIGSGSVTLSFQHVFSVPAGAICYQRATVVGAGQFDEAVTAHGPPETTLVRPLETLLQGLSKGFGSS